MEAALQKVWENIEAYLQQSAIVAEGDSEEMRVPIAPNSDPDIKAIVIAVLRRDKSLRKQRGKRGRFAPLF